MLRTVGRRGNAGSLYFDGVSSKLITGVVNFNKGNVILHYNFWINRQLGNTIHTIISTGQYPDAGFVWLYKRYNSKIYIQYSNGIAIKPIFLFDITADGWYNIGITFNYSSGVVDCYLDGNYILTRYTNGQSLFPLDRVTYFGSYGVTNAYFLLGGLSNVTIYNRDVHANEIKLIYQGLPISRAGLVGEWKMNEMDGNIAYDTSGNGNHATIYGANYTTDKPY